jgi:hypothetical protein
MPTAKDPQTELTAAIVAMNQHARGLAAAWKRFQAAADVVRRAATTKDQQEESKTLRRTQEVTQCLAALPVELASHLAGLGLSDVVADASVARGATGADRTGRFVARWTARVQQLVA